MSDTRYFKSALSERRHRPKTGDTSLALPAEGNMAVSREQSANGSARVRQQVQLTLARRSRSATSNGNVYSQDSTIGSGKGHQYSVMVQSPPHLGSMGMHSLKRLTRRMELSRTSSPGISHQTHFGSQDSGTGSQGAYTLPAATSFKRYAHSEMLPSQRVQGRPQENQNKGSLQGSYMEHQRADSLTILTAVRGNGRCQTSRQNSHKASLASMELDGLVGQTGGTLAAAKLKNQNGVRVMNGWKQKGHEPELTLERAVNQLSHTNTDMQVSSAYYIQHQCFINPWCRKRLLHLGGIPKLLQVLESDSEELQKASVGALRNTVFENDNNKMEVKDKNGIQCLLRLLKTTRDIETRKQITGLLWNLSSHDLLKDHLSREALQTLTDYVIIPCSGIAEGENPKDDLLAHPDIFYNATGCLRNLSSAGPDTRNAMRQCDNLIDALVHYVQRTIADHKPDDKSTENCVCILHNLSYQIDAEVPQRLPALQQRPAPLVKTPGCFGSRSNEIAHVAQLPLLEEKSNPQGKEWLWSPIAVRLYLSLLACSNNRYTQEAATGALLNATAGSGMMQQAIAHTIVQKEKGLQQVKRMLKQPETDVRKVALSLLKNLSRHDELHGKMVDQVLPELITMLPNSGPGADVPLDITVQLCNILNNLSQSKSDHVRAIANHGGLGKIIGISSSDNRIGSTRACQAASALLHTMWQHKDLRLSFNKAGYRKEDFINSSTVKPVSWGTGRRSKRDAEELITDTRLPRGTRQMPSRGSGELSD